jgi:hypothetical protein
MSVGYGADAASAKTAIRTVAVLTGASGVLVTLTEWQPRRALVQPAEVL